MLVCERDINWQFLTFVKKQNRSTGQKDTSERKPFERSISTLLTIV